VSDCESNSAGSVVKPDNPLAVARVKMNKALDGMAEMISLLFRIINSLYR